MPVGVDNELFIQTSDAAGELIWCIFLEEDVPTIYSMLTQLAELENVGSEDILQAWTAFNELRAATDYDNPNGL
jgi:hypothetical protein